MGSLEGVVATEAGWIDSYEVVTVRFDPKRLGHAELFKHAKEHGCTTRVWTTSEEQLRAAKAALGERALSLGRTTVRPANESDQVYYLRLSPMRFLPLTPLQARRVNSALHAQMDPRVWLSPRQLSLLEKIEAKLSRDPAALDDLKRPAHLAELDEYQASVSVAVD